MSVAIDQVFDQPRIKQVRASAGQTAFDYPFAIFASADLRVNIDGTDLAPTAYSVSGVGNDNGGTVTLNAGATLDALVTIYAETAINRLTDYQFRGRFDSERFNNELDRMTINMQELRDQVRRTLRLPLIGEHGAAAGLELPQLVAQRADQLIGFDDEGKLTMRAPSYRLEAAPAPVATIGAMTGLLAPADGDAVLVAEDGRGGLFEFDAAATGAADNGVTFKAGDATVGSWVRRHSGPVNVRWFGAVGDGVTDDTAALTAALASPFASSQGVYLPPGDFVYSSLPNLARSNFIFRGAGSGVTTLRYTGSATAMTLDAFASGSPVDPFVNNLDLGGFKIRGAAMTRGIFAQGVARSRLRDVRVNGSAGTDGTIGYDFAGFMLSRIEDIYTSYEDGDVPYRGIVLRSGTRASVSVGACSNNLFKSIYPEGNAIGLQLSGDGSDQNVFLVGAPESCSVYGQIVGSGCRYNTFIGMGYENLDVLQRDVLDEGEFSRYLNCYSSERFTIAGSSRGCEVSGGYFERLEVLSGAFGATVNDVKVNHWNAGSGGFFNAGTGTRWRNVRNSQTDAQVYAQQDRTGITVGASPFEWTNQEGIPVKVRIYAGTVTQVLLFRGADSWVEPNPTASGGGTGTTGIYLLAPGDKINVSYSALPAMNLIPMAGM